MGGLIFVIIVIVVYAVAMGKQKNRRGHQHHPVLESQYARPVQPPKKNNRSNNSLSRKANAANGAGSDYRYTVREKEAAMMAAELARDNMQADELANRMSAEEFRERAGIDKSDGAILMAAKMHSLAAELSNEYDSGEDLMEPVYEAMVVGPDTSIPNERDFLAEGEALINSYTLPS